MSDHDTNNRHCWCQPDLYAPCPECDGEGCWRCGDPYKGLVPTEDPDEDETLVIVHRDL